MRKTLALLSTIAWSILICCPAHAAIKYWDLNAATAGAGGAAPAGTWNTTIANWSTDATGSSATAAFTGGGVDSAVFAAGTDAIGTYTVNLSSTLTAVGLMVEEGTVQLTGSALTVGATPGAITINSGAQLSTYIGSTVIGGAAGATIVLNGGTLENRNTGNAGSFVSPVMTITLNGGGTLKYDGANLLNILQTGSPGTSIAGVGPLIKTGQGVLAAGVACTYSGQTIINAGELRIRNAANRLPITTDMVVNSPGILNLNNVAGTGVIGQQVASLSGNGTVGLSGSVLYISNNVGSSTFSGVLADTANAGASGSTAGSGRVTKDGASTLILAGPNTFSGRYTNNNGTLTVNAGAAWCGAICDVTINNGTVNLNNTAQTIENLVGAGGNLVLGTGHTLTIANVSSCTYSGTISGNGGIIKTNVAASNQTLTLSGINSYDGTTAVNGGRLSVGSSSALGSSSGGTTVGTGGELLFDGAATVFTINEPFSITGVGVGDGGVITVQSSANIVVGGPVTLTGDSTVTVAGSSTVVYNNPSSFTSAANQSLTLAGGAGAGGGGTISGAVALNNGGLTKTNGGTWTLSGSSVSTYTGPTRIVGGTLRVDGSLNGGGTLTVTNGTLSGTGTINKDVTTLGGTAPGGVAPGPGIGTLVVNGILTMNGTATMEIDRNAGQTADKIAGLSSVTYGGTLTVINTGAPLQFGDTFALFSAGGYGGSFSTLNLPSLPAGLFWDTSGLGTTGTIKVGALIVLTCSSNITVTATSAAGAVVTYTSSATGGCSPPPFLNCTPPSGSTFPIGTTIVTCTASDSCGTITNCSFQVTVNSDPAGQEYFSKDNSLPPTNTVYISPDQWHVLFASGIVIKDASHDQFTASHPPPGLGTTIFHVFNSGVGFDISTDNGATYTHVTATANSQVQVTHTFDAGGIEHYDNEMLGLDFTVPTGLGPVMLRESPTLQSTGKTSIRAVAGGNLIASFFDIWVECSTDGGVTWQPASGPAHVEMRNDPNAAPEVAEGTPLLPPPQDKYVSPEQWHALFAMGIVIKDVSHDFFTQGITPPTGSNTTTESFNSRVDFKVSTDGGLTYQDVSASAPVNVNVKAVGSPSSGRYDTEMTGLSLSGLPGGLMIRESPTLPSRGGTKIDPQPDGTYKMHSFFDIFPEISTDSGASWSPATNGAVRMNLSKRTPEVPKPTPNLPPPDGNYVSPADWHAFYAMGIVISNASHDRFLNTQPPPPPGATNFETFGSEVKGQISFDGGLTFTPFAAPANVTVTVGSTTLDNGSTRFFNTEMTQLDISGGSLPAGVMVRESPSKASLGRTSIRNAGPGDFRIESFFDIFTEVSMDFGASWSPQTNKPVQMFLTTNQPSTAIILTCPSNITVQATSAAGAVVNFAPTASGGCGPLTVIANPSSGSTFPIGTTVVTVTASDACGGFAQCQFQITVTPLPPPDYFFPQPVLPPINSVYISPAQWHVLYSMGIIIRDVRHRGFTQHYPLPPLGAGQLETFSSELDFEVSFDNGATFTPGTGTAQVSVQVTHTSDDSSGSHFDTEMLQLDLLGPGFRLRESPTLQSTGQTTVRPVTGGYMIDSFFDVFTEISLDNGVSWTPANGPGHVECRPDPETVTPVSHPTDLLPPPNGGYVSPQQWHALYAAGIVIKDVSHKFFTESFPPPPSGGSNSHSFNSVVDMSISLDGGATYQFVRASAPVTISVTAQGAGTNRFYDTEMLALSLSGLPAGVMIRESPSLPSRGCTLVKTNGLPPGDPDFDLLRIGSFFDIFTEVSLDGGASWLPATNGPVRMELTEQSPEVPEPTPNLPPPDGTYISPEKWHALYASGIIITNASHDRFLNTQPPPPPGNSQIENLGSRIRGLISMDGGATFQPFSANAGVQVLVNSHSSLDTPSTRFFDTEMLSLNLSGGSLPGGVMVRESPSKASLGRTTVRQGPYPQPWRISSFFDVFTEISTDGGATWSPSVTAPGTMGLNPPPTNVPPIVLTCSSNITVTATSAAGAVVTYTSSATGGCPPVNVNCNPPSGSTFPIGTTIVTCFASDACGQTTNCSFQITVNPPTPQAPEYFYPQKLLPPINSVYISPAQWHVLYSMGIIIRDVRHRGFTQHFPPPPPGVTQTHSFSSELDFDLSMDNGATFTPATGTANVTVQVTHSLDSGGIEFYDTEMLALDLVSGPIRLRESPTLQSLGKTTVRQVPGGYMIGSFFDIFTEVSLDGGVSWTPANGSGHVECHPDPEQVTPVPEPTPLLPPPNGSYISPQQWHALYAAGIVIRDVRHKIFTGSLPPPPPGATNIHSFDSQLDMQVSTDGGSTYQYVRVAAPVQVSVASHGSSTDTIYDTEMLSLNLTLPNGVMIRESPSLPSRGQTEITPQPDGTWRIGSFFDIFTEVSLDGGASWSGATNGPVRVELSSSSVEVPKPNPNLPPLDGTYVSPAQWHALYASGIIITNASHDRFTQTQPPPPPGGSQTESFSSRVTGQISLNGGATFQPFSAPAFVQVQVTSSLDSGPTRFFNTEMLSLNLQGGTLPGGVMVRESPSKASLGRTSVRTTASGYMIDSFFDVFTEVSLDGGATWSPGVTHPGTMGLTTNPPIVGIILTCSSNIVVTAPACSNSAVVTYLSSADGGCPPVNVSCNPPSGSTFPLGVTTVTCTATDGCGQTTNCSFTVTVNPAQCQPLIVNCSSNITVAATSAAGAVVTYSSSASGGCLPPPTLVCNPPSGSTFPIGTTTVTCVAHDGCGNTMDCSFTVKVVKLIITIKPVGGGFELSWPVGTLQDADNVLGPYIDVDPQPVSPYTFTPTPKQPRKFFRVRSGEPGFTWYDTELLQLDISGGNLPPGMRLRESPTLASTGKTAMSPNPGGGFTIDSFFDVFTELSLDNGASWMVSTGAPPHMRFVGTVPNNTLPPRDANYVSPNDWHALYAAGIYITNASHLGFLGSFPPPPPGGVTQTHSFGSTVQMQVRPCPNCPPQPVNAPANVTVKVTSRP